MKKQRTGYTVIGGLCSLMAMSATASPVISELFYDAGGSDAGKVFVELFGLPGEALDGMVLEGVNGSNGSVYTVINLSGVIPVDGVFVIGDGSGGITSVPNTDLIAGVDFQNGPDSVVLRNGNRVLDAVGYGNFSAQDVFAGEGSAALDPSAGSSIARVNAAVDNDDNRLDFLVLDTPTPGLARTVSAVPLPASVWLFVSGLLALLGLRGKNAA